MTEHFFHSGIIIVISPIGGQFNGIVMIIYYWRSAKLRWEQVMQLPNPASSINFVILICTLGSHYVFVYVSHCCVVLCVPYIFVFFFIRCCLSSFDGVCFFFLFIGFKYPTTFLNANIVVHSISHLINVKEFTVTHGNLIHAIDHFH